MSKGAGWLFFGGVIVILVIIISSITRGAETKDIQRIVSADIKRSHYGDAINIKFDNTSTERINETFSTPSMVIKTVEGTFETGSEHKRFTYVVKSVGSPVEWDIQTFETIIE